MQWVEQGVQCGFLAKGGQQVWPYLNPSNGVYDWTTLDRHVEKAEAQNVDTFYSHAATPSWVMGGDTTGCVWNGIVWKCPGPPTSEALTAFWTALVTRYEGRIKYYELYNEPDLLAPTISAENLAFQANIIVPIIRAIDPAALIIAPSMYGGHQAYVNDYYAAGGPTDVDIVSIHGYPHTNHVVAETIVYDTVNPNGSLLTSLQPTLAAYGLQNKPIWDTESSWGPNSVLTNITAQAAFTMRHLLLHWSMGISKYLWFMWDGGTATQAAGVGTLLNPETDVLMRAGTAYAKMQEWMLGATMPESATQVGTVWTCRLTRSEPEGYESIVVWDTAGDSTYVTPGGYRFWTDFLGKVNLIPANRQITIGNMPLLLEKDNSLNVVGMRKQICAPTP